MRRISFICLMLIAICLILSACINSNSADKNEIVGRLTWLTGEWVSPDNNSHESWHSVDDSTLSGFSCTITAASGDTVFKEHMTLEYRMGNLYFVPSIVSSGSNNTVNFRLVSDSGDVYVFENKTHDFPQRIVYAHPSKDSIYAYIDGVELGRYHKEEFPYRRLVP